MDKRPAAGGGGEVEFRRIDIDESNPLLVEMKAKQDALVKSAVEQIEQQFSQRKVFEKTDDHLKRVAAQLVATDQMMGPFNLDALDNEFGLVIEANTDIVLREMKTAGFAIEFAKRFFDTSQKTDSELLNIACKALKISVRGATTLVMAAECFSRASTITRIFNATLGHTGFRHFIRQLGTFMRDPQAENYKEFKLNNPVAFGILSRVADVSTIENFIFIVHLCLSKWANPDPVDAAAAAANPPPPPAPPPGDAFGAIVELSRKTIAVARRAAGSVLNLPTLCFMGFGWDLEGDIADRLDNCGVRVVLDSSSYLQKKDTSFQKVATLTQTAMRFGDCFDDLGLNPEMVSVCIMSLRSKRRQDILDVLVSKGKTIEEATGMLKRVYPESTFECPTTETLALLQELFPNGHQDVMFSDSNIAVAGSPQADFIARLRDLMIGEKDWGIVDWLMELSADRLRMLSERVVAPVFSQMGVVMERNAEPAAKVNPLLTRRNLAMAVSKMLPQEEIFNQLCNSARDHVVDKLMKTGLDKGEAEKVVDNCKKHFQWAYSNRRELFLAENGQLVYKLVTEPLSALEAELRQYKFDIEKKLRISPKTIFDYFWEGLITAGAAVGGAVVKSWEHISGNRPSAADEGCKLLPLVLATPPYSLNADLVIASVDAGAAAAGGGAAAAGGGAAGPPPEKKSRIHVKKHSPLGDGGGMELLPRPPLTIHVKPPPPAMDAAGAAMGAAAEDDVSSRGSSASGNGQKRRGAGEEGNSSDDGDDGGGGGGDDAAAAAAAAAAPAAASGVMEVGEEGAKGARRGGGNLSSKKSGSKSRKNTKRTRRHSKGRKPSKAAKKTKQRRSSRHRRSSRKGRK
jgi:hypothetical protein